MADKQKRGASDLKNGKPSPSLARALIVRRRGVCGGDPCIAGTRIPVWVLYRARQLGASDKRLLNMFVSLPWPEIAVAFVQIRYDDPVGGVRFDEQIDLDPQARVLRRSYPIAENGPRALGYRLTILTFDGALMEGSWRETEDDRLVIDRRLVERRLVTMRPIGGSLRENRLIEARIRLEAHDPDSDTLRASTELLLAGDNGGAQSWEYLLGDPPAHFQAQPVGPLDQGRMMGELAGGDPQRDDLVEQPSQVLDRRGDSKLEREALRRRRRNDQILADAVYRSYKK